MPNWNGVVDELDGRHDSKHDKVCKKYLKRLADHTGRNVLVYYSGWLQRPGARPMEVSINDADTTGFMTCSHKLDRDKGLDLVLHTPGGDLSATEAIIKYLRSLYDGNVRAIVPQLAMSGGTLMAMSCKSIVMGRQSSLGPVDPQINGVPAQGLLEEFERAAEQIKAEPHRVALWQPIIGKYHPTIINSCIRAIEWSDQLMREYLTLGMLKDKSAADRNATIDKVAVQFGRVAESKAHSRHIDADTAEKCGLVIERLEDDQTLQDAVLSLHYALTLTMSQTSIIKIIENQRGVGYMLGGG